MDKQEAKLLIRRINELHYELHPEPLTKDDIRRMEQEIKTNLIHLKEADFPAALIHADFLTSCGRYVFLDDIAQ